MSRAALVRVGRRREKDAGLREVYLGAGSMEILFSSLCFSVFLQLACIILQSEVKHKNIKRSKT